VLELGPNNKVQENKYSVGRSVKATMTVLPAFVGVLSLRQQKAESSRKAKQQETRNERQHECSRLADSARYYSTSRIR